MLLHDGLPRTEPVPWGKMEEWQFLFTMARVLGLMEPTWPRPMTSHELTLYRRHHPARPGASRPADA